MFIQTETTPNPDSLKFFPGRVVSSSGPKEFSGNPEKDGASSRLAEKLLSITGARAVFFGYDFITVTKTPEASWDILKQHVLTTIADYLLTGLPFYSEDSSSPDEAAQVDGPIVTQIRELIETRVRPSVAMDGGDITFQKFEDGVVYLHLRGACAGCPSSSATLKSGIENMLRHYVPEVLEVRAVSPV